MMTDEHAGGNFAKVQLPRQTRSDETASPISNQAIISTALSLLSNGSSPQPTTILRSVHIFPKSLNKWCRGRGIFASLRAELLRRFFARDFEHLTALRTQPFWTNAARCLWSKSIAAFFRAVFLLRLFASQRKYSPTWTDSFKLADALRESLSKAVATFGRAMRLRGFVRWNPEYGSTRTGSLLRHCYKLRRSVTWA